LLPAPLTDLVGRERELAQLAEVVAGHRLVTVCGAGGVGKTRLALALVAMGVAHADRVLWTTLSDLPDPGRVPARVGASLGLTDGAGPERLARELRPLRALLVLDGCEHLTIACGDLAQTLLGTCPRLTVLATSREPLRVLGEVVWRLDALPVPPPGLPAEEVARWEAVQLFAERASAVRPGFVLSGATALAAARICRRLEGNPLAIELAAARMNSLSAPQLDDQLQDALAVLTSAPRLAPARHRSLRASLTWSYETLEAEQRLLFNRLSVFSAPARLDAVRAVCSGPDLPSAAVLDHLSRLIEGSLVVAVEEGGEIRYRLRALDAQYGREKLAAAGELDLLRARHARYFAALAGATDEVQEGWGEWAERMEAVLPDLRTALEWCLEHDPEGALRAVSGVAWYLRTAGALAEARHWLERALARPGPDSRARARALRVLGCVLADQGHGGRARELLEEAFALCRRRADDAGAGLAERSLGLVLATSGELECARAHLECDLERQRQRGDRRGLQRALYGTGLVAMAQGRTEEARDYLERSAELARELGDGWALARAVGSLGDLALDAGDLATARFRLAIAIGGSARVRDLVGVAARLDGFARLAAARGRAERAVTLAMAAAALRSRAGSRRPPVEAVTACRRLLRPDRLMAAEARGATMDVERAVEFALQEQDDEEIAPAWASERGRRAGLSAREWEVIALVMAGLTNRAIAVRLSISPNTVNKHVASILEKLGAHCRAQAIALVLGIEGLVATPGTR
jgi:serine/threonine-protein kinase PknK